MCTAYDIYGRKNKDGAKIIMVKKITMMQWTTFNCWF